MNYTKIVINKEGALITNKFKHDIIKNKIKYNCFYL